ncbi:uncharacterized protein OCT59_011688 [Rhizophagus irregularis]|uniref:uncharacterized protein n=1 Tax=Rhizophagus irregularis TaxID=588596 RepID=UPI0019F8A9BB|nr:hypothetical protein OCT59_011688 [Rhizophagus irregularis]GBC39301.2 hypothetical protein GLOIN_2v1779634 [Rhizophagus irregularis DAOM 181602=DAOM 197198]
MKLCWAVSFWVKKNAFPVDYDISKTIGHLKNAIKEKKSVALGNIDANTPKLWKVNIPESKKHEINEGIDIKEKFRGISTSSCNASTRYHWNHRWTTSIPMKRLGESQDSNCESVAPFERDFWNDLPKVQIVLKSSDGVNKYQEFRAIIQIYES